MKTQHTPTPWAMHPIYTKGILTHWGINGVTNTETMFTSGRIVDVPRNAPNHDGPTQEANAEFIIRAVNAHNELLQACKFALGQLEGCKPLSGVHAGSLKADIEIIKAAIAKAE